MKKLLLVLAIIIGLSTGANAQPGANAQVCIISGANDNVEILNLKLFNDEKVVVTVGNDSRDISANVTVEVAVTYINVKGNKKVKNYDGKALAKPNTATPIEIKIEKNYPNPDYKIIDVKALKITGTKCR